MKEESVLAYLEGEGVKTERLSQGELFQLRELLKKGIHFSDAVHAAIAIKEKCDCIVTFNVKDFEKIQDKIAVFEPAEF